MDTTIEIYNKNVYGRDLFYPHNDNAKRVTKLLGKKTLNLADIKRLEAIGFTVKNLTFSPDQD